MLTSKKALSAIFHRLLEFIRRFYKRIINTDALRSLGKFSMAQDPFNGTPKWPFNATFCASTAMDISSASTTEAESLGQDKMNPLNRPCWRHPHPVPSKIAKRSGTRASQRPTALEFMTPFPSHAGTESSGSPSLPAYYGSGDAELLRRSRFDEIYNYRELRALGHGGNGSCFLLERRTDKALRVCKVIRGVTEKGRDQMLREVHVLRDILPPNERILRAYEVIQNPRQCQLYFEYCDGGDLRHFIRFYKSHNTSIPESFIWHAFIQLSEALAFIHYGYDYRHGWTQNLPIDWQSVIHADLKPENVFLRLPTRPWEYPSLVLGDFGAAQFQPGCDYVGTFQWMPPEIPSYSCKADVWSLGAIIHALAHLGLPPIAELPDDVPFTPANWQNWCCLAESREVAPLLEYSVDLEDTMLEAMRWDVIDRYTSYEVLVSVRYEIECGVAAKEIWEPLLDEYYAGWLEDANGRANAKATGMANESELPR